MKSSTKALIGVVAVAAVFGIFFLILSLTGAKAMTPKELKHHIDENNVKELAVTNDIVSVKLRNDNTAYECVLQLNNYEFTVPRTEQRLALAEDGTPQKNGAGELVYETVVTGYDKYNLTGYLEIHNAQAPADLAIAFTMNNRNSGNIWSVLIPVISFAALVVIAVFLFRSLGSANKQALNFSKSHANAQGNIKVRFADVAGAEEEKEELKEIVDFLKSPHKFTNVGARIPRGVLLVGPPGTGKTLFAKAVAGEADVPFFSISGSDFVEMYVGVGASRVRDLFDVAKKNMPCIIFIDEIDAVGRQRGAGMGGGHDEREQTLNQLLVQMDGFQTNEGIIVMAATNRADILDPALMRPGRFDRQVYVNVPDVRGREAIFKVHARNKPISPEVDFQVLARITSGFTGADIANLLNEAAILCARAGRTVINNEDVYEGINKVTMGPAKKSRLVTETDKRRTAYHEAGHAIIAKSLPYSDVVHEVSIIPRGAAGGYTALRPENDDNDYTFNHLTAVLAMKMGGRAAEELVIQDMTAGPSHDLKTATDLARKMVMEWGMSGLGPISYAGSQEVFLGRDYGTTHSYSETVATKIDTEVARILDEAYATAIRVLTEKTDILNTMARVLLECETIYAEEVDMIMTGKNAAEVKTALNERLKTKYAARASEPARA
ncbi:MAG: ATP-dependent zinc metalloprotease FtsH [Clostridiales bacterium]|nr:ATP-dependent zinc metalloprotease FtsH [Clostridiales bacterium]